MESSLRIRFLGSFELQYPGERDGPPQSLLLPATLKAQSLLAYLIVHRRRPHSRDHLAELFWGDRPERNARRSLSTALWQIRRCLPQDGLLLAAATHVRFSREYPLWLDTQAFEALAAQLDFASLQAAVDLYRGDFLDGFYDDWVIGERYRLESVLLDVLALLMAAQEALGSHQQALATARQLLDKDPLREDAHRMVMRAHCHLGQRQAALSQYRSCRHLLRQELDAAPMAETRALHRAILDGSFACAAAPAEMVAVPLTFPRPAPGHSPLDAAARIPLVGREGELAFLAEAWQAALRSGCSLLLVSGEAGIGKTRLAQEFADRQRWQGIRILQGRCYEFERVLPYQPMAEVLRSLPPTLAAWSAAAVPEWITAQVARLAPDLFAQERAQPGATPAGLQGGEEQERLFDGVSRFLAQVASQAPLLLILEDLHWATDSTLQLLHYLARALIDQPLLIVGTLRLEAVHAAHPLVTLDRRLAREGLARRLHLSPLSAAAVAALIGQLSGAGEAAGLLADRLYQETEGNPFYLIETIKALFEQGAIRLEAGAWQGDFEALSRTDLPLPASVEEMIRARVARLGEDAQDALQLASVLGKAFDFDFLRTAWGQDEEATLVALDDLLRGRLIAEAAEEAEPDYLFTHHKIQEVVYSGLPRRQRQYLHGQVGIALERLLGTQVGTRAGELAFHFEQARQLNGKWTKRAIDYLLQAGEQAERQSAHQEALAYYQRGLDILRSSPDTPQRLRQEIDLQIALALPTTVVHGYGSLEARRVYEKARQLCRQHGDAHTSFTTLVGLARYYGMAGDLATAVELAEQLVTSAEAAGHTGWLVEACRLKGGFVFGQGRVLEAQAVLERGLALYDLAYHERHANRFGHDPAVAILNYLNLALWLLGHPAQAIARAQQLERLAQAMVQPTSQVIAQCMLAKSACMRRDGTAALSFAQEGIRLSEVYGQSLWKGLARALQGSVLCDRGDGAQGLPLLVEGIAAWRATGNRHFTPFLLALQAEAALKARRLDVGYAALADGLAIASSGGDTYWLAELHRLRGELLWAEGKGGSAVEADFLEAQATARRQAARMLQLRASMSLARLWQSQDRIHASRQLLTEVYGHFDEGFDTPDLAEARRLIDSLG